MVLRFLTAALFCEGPEDDAFLCPVLERQLRRLGMTGKGFEFESVVSQGCLTAKARSGRLDEWVIEAAQSFDLVFLHNDDDQRQKCVHRDDRLNGKISPHARTVNVIPVRETEAWALVDRAALPGGGERQALPVRVREVEKIPDPKAALKQALGRRYSPELAEAVGLGISLDRLAEVPAYQSFLQELTAALKELNFL